MIIVAGEALLDLLSRTLLIACPASKILLSVRGIFCILLEGLISVVFNIDRLVIEKSTLLNLSMKKLLICFVIVVGFAR